ncbi:hypothetical protein [Nocardia niwae]|uniref:Uncharacterized protein n=1 Tax=Nocardia niwae TaxID=626084 RepID=A0ABV2XA92_9NOCA
MKSHELVSDTKRTGRISRFSYRVLVPTVAVAAVLAPAVSAPQAVAAPAKCSPSRAGVVVCVVEGVTWLIKEGAKTLVIDGVLKLTGQLFQAQTGPRTMEEKIRNAPRVDPNSIRDPQDLVRKAADLPMRTDGIGHTAVVKGDAVALFRRLAHGQRLGDNSYRNGVETVTLTPGTKSEPPRITISNAATKTAVIVLE